MVTDYRPVEVAAEFPDGNKETVKRGNSEVRKRDGAIGTGANADGADTDSSGNVRKDDDAVEAAEQLAN
jgi:hypothetical protein